MTALRYSVEQVDKDRAREDLLRVWRENLSVESSCERKFSWTYEGAPAAPLSPLLLVARRGDQREVVGSAGVARRAFAIDGEDAWAGLLADLAVDREHRTARPALALVRRARETARERVPFAYGFPNRKAEAVFGRAGWTTIGRIARYVRVLRHARYARPLLRSGAAAAAAGIVADGGVFLRHAPGLASTAARYRLGLSDAADERMGEVWRAAAPSYRILARRNPEFLRWRLADRPEQAPRFFWLEERDSGAARAYAAVAEEGGHLVVRDFPGPPDVLASLFERLALWGRIRGAFSLTLRFFGDPRVERALGAAGFYVRDSSRAVVAEAFCLGYEFAYDPAAWFLTDADEDT